MQHTYTVQLLKFIQREWEGRKYYKCRVVTEDAEVLDLNVQATLVTSKPEILKLTGVVGLAHVSIVSGQKNSATMILTDFIPERSGK